LFILTTRSNFLPETGECDDPLIARIREFQLRRLRIKTADCRIDVQGRTLAVSLDIAANSGYRPIGRMESRGVRI